MIKLKIKGPEKAATGVRKPRKEAIEAEKLGKTTTVGELRPISL